MHTQCALKVSLHPYRFRLIRHSLLFSPQFATLRAFSFYDQIHVRTTMSAICHTALKFFGIHPHPPLLELPQSAPLPSSPQPPLPLPLPEEPLNLHFVEHFYQSELHLIAKRDEGLGSLIQNFCKTRLEEAKERYQKGRSTAEQQGILICCLESMGAALFLARNSPDHLAHTLSQETPSMSQLVLKSARQRLEEWKDELQRRKEETDRYELEKGELVYQNSMNHFVAEALLLHNTLNFGMVPLIQSVFLPPQKSWLGYDQRPLAERYRERQLKQLLAIRSHPQELAQVHQALRCLRQPPQENFQTCTLIRCTLGYPPQQPLHDDDARVLALIDYLSLPPCTSLKEGELPSSANLYHTLKESAELFALDGFRTQNASFPNLFSLETLSSHLERSWIWIQADGSLLHTQESSPLYFWNAPQISEALSSAGIKSDPLTHEKVIQRLLGQQNYAQVTPKQILEAYVTVWQEQQVPEKERKGQTLFHCYASLYGKELSQSVSPSSPQLQRAFFAYTSSSHCLIREGKQRIQELGTPSHIMKELNLKLETATRQTLQQTLLKLHDPLENSSDTHRLCRAITSTFLELLQESVCFYHQGLGEIIQSDGSRKEEGVWILRKGELKKEVRDPEDFSHLLQTLLQGTKKRMLQKGLSSSLSPLFYRLFASLTVAVASTSFTDHIFQLYHPDNAQQIEGWEQWNHMKHTPICDMHPELPPPLFSPSSPSHFPLLKKFSPQSAEEVFNYFRDYLLQAQSYLGTPLPQSLSPLPVEISGQMASFTPDSRFLSLSPSWQDPSQGWGQRPLSTHLTLSLYRFAFKWIQDPIKRKEARKTFQKKLAQASAPTLHLYGQEILNFLLPLCDPQDSVALTAAFTDEVMRLLIEREGSLKDFLHKHSVPLLTLYQPLHFEDEAMIQRGEELQLILYLDPILHKLQLAEVNHTGTFFRNVTAALLPCEWLLQEMAFA